MLTIKKKRSKNYIGTSEDNDTSEMIRKLIKEVNEFFSEKPYRYSLKQKDSDFYLYRRDRGRAGKDRGCQEKNNQA